MALTTVRPQGMGFVTGRRNLIINGAMLVDQRNTTTTYSNSGGFGAADRISYRRSGTWTTTTFDISQEDTSGLNGFPKCSQIKVQDAAASPNANNDTWCGFRYAFEGNELQQLAWGTSDAQAITLSFHVKSSVAGTYCVGFRIGTDDRSYVAEYTINSADTFERKTITVPAPTTSEVDTKFVNDNSSEMELYWVASGNTTGTSANRGSVGWSDGAVYYTANQANAFPAINDVFQITGIQLELGENASDFEHRSFGEELAACQRYYFQTSAANSGGAYQNLAVCTYISNTTFRGIIEFPTTMRAIPTFSSTGSFQTLGGFTFSSVGAGDGATTGRHGIQVVTSENGSGGQSLLFRANNDSDAVLIYDAEL